MTKSRHIRTLLLKHFLLASLLPTLLMSALVCGVGFNMLVSQAVQKNSAALELAASAVESDARNIRNIAYGLPSINGTSSAMSEDSLYSLLLKSAECDGWALPPQQLALFKRVQAMVSKSYLSTASYINGVHLILANNNVLSFGGTFCLQSGDARQLTALATAAEFPLLLTHGLGEVYARLNALATGINMRSSFTYITEISRLTGEPGSRLALVAIDVNDSFFRPLDYLAQSHSAQICAADSVGEVIFSTEANFADTVRTDVELNASLGQLRARYDFFSQRIVCSYPLTELAGVTLLYSAAVNPLSIVEPTLLISALTGALAIAYAVCMAVRNSHRFAQPIVKLCEVMTTDKRLPRSIAPYYDITELRTLYLRYNEMLDSIARYIKQHYESELALSRMKLRAMESQMDSHFLYNTLECIYSMALMSDMDDIARVTKSLSDTFRYISRTEGATVTVRAELNHVRDYVTIQRARLGDDVSCVIRIDEALWDRRMLKLTLQPLVENAFKHGLTPGKKPRNLYLDGEHINGMLRFTVRDNGIGIAPDKLRRIRLRLEEGHARGEDDSMGIGLLNISNRLRLYYGNAASLTIESQPMQGTLVILTLPEGDVE